MELLAVPYATRTVLYQLTCQVTHACPLECTIRLAHTGFFSFVISMGFTFAAASSYCVEGAQGVLFAILPGACKITRVPLTITPVFLIACVLVLALTTLRKCLLDEQHDRSCLLRNDKVSQMQRVPIVRHLAMFLSYVHSCSNSSASWLIHAIADSWRGRGRATRLSLLALPFSLTSPSTFSCCHCFGSLVVVTLQYDQLVEMAVNSCGQEKKIWQTRRLRNLEYSSFLYVMSC